VRHIGVHKVRGVHVGASRPDRIVGRTLHGTPVVPRKAAYQGDDPEGGGDSTFVMNAALETIAGHKSTLLKPVDQEAFFDALDREADPKPRLRVAIEHHSRTIVSK
jgi:hypothetical protein